MGGMLHEGGPRRVVNNIHVDEWRQGLFSNLHDAVLYCFALQVT